MSGGVRRLSEERRWGRWGRWGVVKCIWSVGRNILGKC